jgi:TPP-dependent pyruvate/acetoin dehydrogenase alpha subunit
MRQLAKVGADNIPRLAQYVLSQSHMEDEEIEALKADAQKTVDDVVEIALQSGQPSLDDALGHLLLFSAFSRLASDTSRPPYFAFHL